MLNNTYYKKLNNILKIPKNKIKDICIEQKNSLLSLLSHSSWGITDAQQSYIDYLEILSNRSKEKLWLLKRKKIKKEINNDFDNKIRIVFFCYEYQTFPTFLSLYNTMKCNEKYSVDLVHVPFFHVDKNYNEQEEINDYINNGFNEIINCRQYNLKKCSPDIAIFLKPYDLIPKEYYIDEIKKVVEKSIYIPYGMEIGSTTESMRYQYQLPLHDEAWMCLSYCTEHYKRAQKFSKYKGENYNLLGHPRMDLINLDLHNDKLYKKIKEKAKGRKIFMWNSHFTVENGDNWGTFLIYGMDILNYFANHKELFLLFRPHPLLKEALKKICNKDQINAYHEIIRKNKDNIYIDESANYLISIHVSDILISDANSFVPEYLMYNKPVIYTKKNGTTGFKNRKLESMLYVCSSSEEIIKKIVQLTNDKDTLKRKRPYMIKNIFMYDEKKSVAEKICEIIENYFK